MDRKFSEDFERHVKDSKGRSNHLPNDIGQADSKSVNNLFQEQKEVQKTLQFADQIVSEPKDIIPSYQSNLLINKISNSTNSSSFSVIQTIQNQNDMKTKVASAASHEENVLENIDSGNDNDAQQQKIEERLSVGKEINYKYRGEFVSAKITRARPDGTYDILLGNGMRQLCVSKSSIRCKPCNKTITKKTLESDNVGMKNNNVSGTKEGKDNLDVLSVGCLVECRYRGKSKYYRATIQKVNNNGTFDLLYEDGDREFRVSRDLIRPRNNEAANSNQAIDDIKDNFKQRQFLGQQSNGETEGGDIMNDNNMGDNEAENKITNIGDSNVRDDESEELALGSKIECRYRGKSKYYPATIKRVHGNGTYDLLYEDGDREFRVEKDLIKFRKLVSTTSKQSNSAAQEDGHLQVPGNECGSRDQAKQSLFREETDTDSIENSQVLAKIDDKNGDISVDEEELVVGTKVECRYKGKTKYYPAVIKKVNENRTFDLLYDDGDREFQVSRNLIKVNKSATGSATKKRLGNNLGKKSVDRNNLRTRSTIRTDNTSFGRRDQLTSSLSKNSIDSVIDNGSGRIDESGSNDSQTEQDSSKDNSDSVGDNIVELVVGCQVECRYRGRTKYYPATIKRKHNNGTYDLLYEDGDREFRVSKDLIRFKKPLSSATKRQSRTKNSEKDDQTREQSLSVSQTRLSPFGGNKSNQKNEPDKNSFNNFDDYGANDMERVDRDIDNNDLQKSFSKRSFLKNSNSMDDENGVNSVLVSHRSSNEEMNNDNFQFFGERRRAGADMCFSVGSRINAQFQGGDTFYPGVITAVRSHGSCYDIKYDDGDVEQNVSREKIQMITSQEEESPKSPFQEERMGTNNSRKQLANSKTDHFTVGSRIQARFQGGNKFYPGIVTAHVSDSAYNILYDDGDREQGVEKSNIRSLHEGDDVIDSGSDDSGDVSNEERRFQSFVGKKIEARFKGNDELYQGDVLEIQSSGAIVIKLHSRVSFSPL